MSVNDHSFVVTPAAIAAVTKLWDLTDMVRVIEDWEATRADERARRGEILAG